jgi:DNA-binding transcriptional MerR regulator
MAENGFVAIGELARRTGVAASALRYYERLGLLSCAQRAGGKRLYTESAAERVALIRLFQSAGFTLAEIGRLVADGSLDREGFGQLAERKITELDARIADARQAKKLINHALQCPHPDVLTCPSFRNALDAQLEHPQASPNDHTKGRQPASRP